MKTGEGRCITVVTLGRGTRGPLLLPPYPQAHLGLDMRVSLRSKTRGCIAEPYQPSVVLPIAYSSLTGFRFLLQVSLTSHQNCDISWGQGPPLLALASSLSAFPFLAGRDPIWGEHHFFCSLVTKVGWAQHYYLLVFLFVFLFL